MKQISASVEVLSQDEILLIHKSALALLEKTGVHVPNAECLKRCKKAGANVDIQTEVVKIPSAVMEDMIAEMRRESNYKPKSVNKLSGGISTQVFVTDYKSKTKRRGVTDDILKGIQLVKHLKNIPGCSAVTLPSDVDSRVNDLYTYKLIYTYSQKDGGTYIINPGAADYIIDMAEAMGRKVAYLFETISPLRLRRETLDMGLRFADRGHPLGIGPMIMGGSTGPITMAGTLTLITAETLASLFAVKAVSGKNPNCFAQGSHTTDMKTMLCSFGSPNQALIGIGAAQMGNFYGIPAGGNAALSDALAADFQCGFEKTFSAVFSMLAGCVFVGCQGIAGADQGFCFEQLVLDNEWIDAYNYTISGYEVTEESIALELMQEVGIGGNFLAEEHTVEHLSDSWWKSGLFDRFSFEAWENDGKRELLDKAAALVDVYTEGYRDMEPVVSGKIIDDLERIYEAGKKAAGVE